MKQDKTLNEIYEFLTERALNDAILRMENYLALNPHQINSDRLFAIKTDYQVTFLLTVLRLATLSRSERMQRDPRDIRISLIPHTEEQFRSGSQLMRRSSAVKL